MPGTNRWNAMRRRESWISFSRRRSGPKEKERSGTGLRFRDFENDAGILGAVQALFVE